jgi:hypothetical protein
MAEWGERKATGDRHEQQVTQELQRRGWEVHPAGQGTYPSAIRHALTRTTSPLRYFPDLIAARGEDVVTIDAKTSMRSTSSGRFAISCKCVTAGLQYMGTHAPVPLLYVFGDLTVLTPAEVAYYTRHGRRAHTGAYYLVNTSTAHHFDDVFGPDTAARGNQRATPPAYSEGRVATAPWLRHDAA